MQAIHGISVWRFFFNSHSPSERSWNQMLFLGRHFLSVLLWMLSVLGFWDSRGHGVTFLIKDDFSFLGEGLV